MKRLINDTAHLTHREVRSGLLQGFWTLLEDRSDAETVGDIIQAAGLPEDVVRDASGWLSYAYYARLNQLVASRLYGLDELPGIDHELWQMWRETPEHAMRHMRVITSMFRAFGSTESAYKAIAGMTAMGNVGLDVEHRPLGPGLAEFVVRAKPEHPDAVGLSSVWKVYGWLERMQTIWGLPTATVDLVVEEDEDQPVYRYRVDYAHSSTDGRLVVGLGLVGALAGALLAPVLAVPVPFGAALGASTALAIMGWGRLFRRTREAREGGHRMRELIDRLDDRYASERRALLTTQKLSGYLAADLVDEIHRNPDARLSLGGQGTDAAVLFSDIVAFTPRCEARSPEEIVDELNTYFAHVDPVFARHGGVIDKRIGDGIMVVFAGRGERTAAQVCHAAVSAAVDSLRAVEACNRALAERGVPPIAIRVGVAHGPLVQGNMGSAERLEYTVIGDTVNLAARLESSAPAAHVLVDAAAWTAAELEGPVAATVTARRDVALKGKSMSIAVVELAPS